jgi:VCBS repeat-containing protein
LKALVIGGAEERSEVQLKLPGLPHSMRSTNQSDHSTRIASPATFALAALLAFANSNAFGAVPQATSVAISGTPEVGFTLTGSYTYNDVDGDPEGDSTYRWLRDGSQIGGEVSQSYDLRQVDEGRLIQFEVTVVAASGDPGELTGNPELSSPVGPIAAANSAPTASNLLITGTAEVGVTLMGSYTYDDADGDPEGSSTLTWLSGNTPINGANGASYTLVAADQGNNIRFRVIPVAQSGVSPGTAQTSEPVGPIVAANSAPTVSNLSIIGTAEVGFTLTGNYTYSDADGDPEGSSTFAWLRNGTPIDGTNATSYTLIAADQGTTVRFRVTPVAQSGVSPGATQTSAPVGPVAAANSAPTASAVTIGGTPQVGSTLTGNYTYGDADGDAEGTSTFAWLRNGNPIAGATNRNYVPVLADNGTNLRFRVIPVAQAGVSPGNAAESPPLLLQNAAPVITGQDPLTTPEDTALAIVISALDIVDPDSDAGSFSLSVMDGTNYTRSGNTITPRQDFNGQLAVPLTVSDGAATSNVFNAVVTVSPVNDGPTANDDSFDVPEGGTTAAGFNVLANDTDPDSSPPILRAEIIKRPTLDPDFVLNNNGTFRYTHDGSETQEDGFTYRACDNGTPSLCSGTAQVTINVNSVNDRPVIGSQANPLTVAEDNALTITLNDVSVTDVDSDPSTFVLSVLNGTNYTRNGNTITPVENFSGELAVPVTVSDGETSSDPFNLTVVVTGVNDAPQITGQVPLSVAEDASLQIGFDDLFVSDSDSSYPDGFQLVLQTGENYTVNANVVVPSPDFDGALNVPAIVNDGELDSPVFTLQISVLAENDVPAVLAEIPDQFAVENQLFQLDVSGNFVDVDGDSLSFSATGLPSSGVITFNQQTGVLSGTPGFDDTRDNDPYLVTVTAEDAAGETVADVFELTISALDRANVSLEVTVSPEPAKPGDQLMWSFIVRNSGPAPAYDLALGGAFVGENVTVAIPAGSIGCAVQPATPGTIDFNCSLPDLQPGASSTSILSAISAVAGDVSVYATAAVNGALPIDPNAADNAVQKSVAIADEFSNGSIQTLGTSAVVSLASGDIDGDSVSDLAVGTIAGRPIEIYLGSGNRTFLTGPVLVPENARNSAIALADITGDGAADLVVANGAGAVDVVYANNGSGQFSLLTSLDSTFANDVALADINMDGDLDIIVATEQANPVYLGNGSGGFALLTSLGAANTQGVEVADVNADNRPDLIFANVGAASEVWLNVNGNGFEQPKSATAGVQKMSAQLPLGDTAGVVAADFDNSGSIDLAFARIPSSTDDIPANPVLLNDGAGNFTLSAQLGTSTTTDIHAGDIDEDGFVDLLFVNSNGVHQVWRGGVAGFSLYSEQIVGNGALVGLLAELGNDGGLDLALGGVQQPGVDLYLNDSFGNLGHGDAVPPSIQLLGETAMEVASGSSFNDPGATASDNIDGDISNRVVASSNVNTAIVGTYQVTYNVTDLAGNSAPAVSRQVTVTPAAGTGGGGGGVVLPYALMLLVLVLAIRLAGKRNRIIHSTVIQQ